MEIINWLWQWYVLGVQHFLHTWYWLALSAIPVVVCLSVVGLLEHLLTRLGHSRKAEILADKSELWLVPPSILLSFGMMVTFTPLVVAFFITFAAILLVECVFLLMLVSVLEMVRLRPTCQAL